MKRQVMIIISVVLVSFLAGTLFISSAVLGIDSHVHRHGRRIKIKIEAYPTTDFYVRYHGLSIDEPLPNGFWLIEGYTFKITASAFTYETTVRLAHGLHYVEYAASGYVIEYAWHARIYVNKVLKAEGEVGRDNPLRADFEV